MAGTPPQPGRARWGRGPIPKTGRGGGWRSQPRPRVSPAWRSGGDAQSARLSHHHPPPPPHAEAVPRPRLRNSLLPTVTTSHFPRDQPGRGPWKPSRAQCLETSEHAGPQGSPYQRPFSERPALARCQPLRDAPKVCCRPPGLASGQRRGRGVCPLPGRDTQ